MRKSEIKGPNILGPLLLILRLKNDAYFFSINGSSGPMWLECFGTAAWYCQIFQTAHSTLLNWFMSLRGVYRFKRLSTTLLQNLGWLTLKKMPSIHRWCWCILFEGPSYEIEMKSKVQLKLRYILPSIHKNVQGSLSILGALSIPIHCFLANAPLMHRSGCHCSHSRCLKDAM